MKAPIVVAQGGDDPADCPPSGAVHFPPAPAVHFDPFTGASMERMVSSEYLFHATQAATAHKVLQAIANKTGGYPAGREIRSTAGLKMNATRSKATVVVYCVPVYFRCE
jgi:hypothetical protein